MTSPSLDSLSEKRCKHCGLTKPLTEYYENRVKDRPRPYYHSMCKPCHYEWQEGYRREHKAHYNELAKEWHRKNRPRMRLRKMARKYGVSEQALEALWVSQDGTCAICKRYLQPEDARIDHDHSTGRVRGLLCDSCNWALGHFRDDATVLAAAIAYLG